MKVKFEVGDRVALKIGKYHPDGVSYTGKVASLSEDHKKVMIEWDGMYGSKKTILREELIKNLIHQEALDAMLPDLETEYKKLASEIGSKIEQAATLISEAKMLSSKEGYSIHSFNEMRPLIDVLEDLGWSSSSLSCL